jgi:hypothetical protein
MPQHHELVERAAVEYADVCCQDPTLASVNVSTTWMLVRLTLQGFQVVYELKYLLKLVEEDVSFVVVEGVVGVVNVVECETATTW